MSRYKFVLKCMLTRGGNGSIPGGFQETLLSDKLVVVTSESIVLREPDHEIVPSGAIAKFCISGTSITVEPLDGSVSVVSPPSDDLPRDLGNALVHHSDATKRCIIYLRPLDIVHFNQHSCKITVVAQDADQPFETDFVKQEEEVQVKSSLVELPDGEVQDGAVDDEESDDEDDLDVGSTTLQTPNEAGETPATSNRTGAATVQDTPLRPKTATDENGIFSTAPDRQQPDDNEVPDSSPTAKAAESPELRSKKQSDRLTYDSIGQSASNSLQVLGTMSSASDNPDSQYIFPPTSFSKRGKPITTYGAHGTPRRERSGTPKTGSSRNVKLLNGQADDLETSGARNEASPEYDQSSEPMDEAGAAGKAAARSTRRSSKRALPVDDDDVAAVIRSAPKKQKQLRTTSETTIADSNGNAPEDDPEDEVLVKAPTANKVKRGRGRPSWAAASTRPKENVATSPQPPSSGKLRMSTRKSADDDDDESADQISVAPLTAKARKPGRGGSSPQVRISPRSMSEPTSTPMSGKPPSQVLLSKSSHDGIKKVSNWLSKQGVTITEDVPGKKTDFVCVVGNGELHMTAKMLRSLALGKKVVTDQWITESMKEGQLLKLGPYIHDDLSETAEVDRGKLFKGKAIFITTELHKQYDPGFANVRALAKEAGASRVDFGTARQGNDKKAAGNMIFMGHEQNDDDAQQLIETYGKIVYKKEMLTQSIIRGEALLEDEDFQLTSAPAKTPANIAARRVRKK